MGADKGLRQMAYDVLFKVWENGAFLRPELDAMLRKYQYLDKRERAFLARLCEGCVEDCIYLDYVIDLYSKIKTGKMKPQIRTILRMGTYQILKMEGVADRAACNESVNLAIAKGFSGLKGFVNGVLRTIAREKDQIALPKREVDITKYLSVVYSTPEWLVSYWRDWLGEEKTEEILRASIGAAKTHVVINTKKVTPQAFAEEMKSQGISWQKDDEVPFAGVIEGYDYLDAVPAFSRGECYVQDLSSLLAIKAAGIHASDVVMDLCSAPGGKAMSAVLLSKDEDGHCCQVSARDLSDDKVEKICENISRTGLMEITPKVWDARVIDEDWREKADVVLCDVPCSGLGVIRRKNDIKYHTSPESIKALQALQREILLTAVTYVRPGGVLLYSTCTITKEENEDNVTWITEGYPFAAEEIRQSYPDETRDGFFYAKLIRQ
ncbi:MAG: 16S rRNA (cytosine(967)-C(5))-methyltransferase RsmB [Lachnospiraceae bacterium]|nr:16S rRNA (cytosine(967)-C(5))-methyltransferase RsmB [Lachnospiraceae bacterium]